MYPDLWFGNTIIYTWTACLHLSYIIGVGTVLIFKPKDFALTRLKLFWMAVIYVIAGLLGAKILSIMLNYIYDPSQSSDTVIRTAGMAFLGAPILGFISVWIFSAGTRTYFLNNTDYAVPFLMLSRAIGRLGCLMEGCCYGISSKLPWAVRTQYEPGLSHPTQAYALIAALAIFITTRIQYRKLKEYRGAVFFIVIALYSLMRFFNEFLRVDSIYVLGFLKLSHIAMIFIFLIGVVGLHFSLRTAPNRKKIVIDTVKLFFVVLLVTTSLSLVALLLLKACL